MILREFGITCKIKSDEAENGKVAVQMYKDQLEKDCCEGYKLILMDLNMPVMNGIRAARHLMIEWTKVEQQVLNMGQHYPQSMSNFNVKINI
jgi:CheY-like chemotaxis protein